MESVVWQVDLPLQSIILFRAACFKKKQYENENIIQHCKCLCLLLMLSVASAQLHRLCWALRNSKEERIDLDAEDKEENGADDRTEEGNISLPYWLSWLEEDSYIHFQLKYNYITSPL